MAYRSGADGLAVEVPEALVAVVLVVKGGDMEVGSAAVEGSLTVRVWAAAAEAS